VDNRLKEVELSIKEIQVDHKHMVMHVEKIAETNEKILEAIMVGNENHKDILMLKCQITRLDPFITIAKYPKAALLAMCGLYLFTIKDIRDPLLALIGLAI